MACVSGLNFIRLIMAGFTRWNMDKVNALVVTILAAIVIVLSGCTMTVTTDWHGRTAVHDVTDTQKGE